MMNPLVTPVVNGNGNTKGSLVRELMDVARKLGSAEQAMHYCDVTNGRNFQTLENHYAMQNKASRAWGERIQALREMIAEIEELAVEINNQPDYR